LVLVGLVNKNLGLIVGVEIIGDKIVVAMVFNGTDKSAERARIAKHATLDGLEDLEKVGVKHMLTVVVRVPKVFHVLGEVTKEEDIVLSDFTSDFNLDFVSCAVIKGPVILTLAPSQVPMIKPPLRTNFMLLVPDASVPAVDMCSLISLAGMIISALLTL